MTAENNGRLVFLCVLCHAPIMEPQPKATVNPDRSILKEAAEIVYGPRREDYGTPSANHGRTAALWAAYLGVPITARQVCAVNILQKLSRDAHAPKRDNLVDVAGYAENADIVGRDG